MSETKTSTNQIERPAYKPGDRVRITNPKYQGVGTIIREDREFGDRWVVLIDPPARGCNDINNDTDPSNLLDLAAAKTLGLPTENGTTYYATLNGLFVDAELIIDEKTPPGTKVKLNRGTIEVEATVVCKHITGGLLVSVPPNTLGFGHLELQQHSDAAKKLGMDPDNGRYWHVPDMSCLKPMIEPKHYTEQSQKQEPAQPQKQEPIKETLDDDLIDFTKKLVDSLTPYAGEIISGELLTIKVGDHEEEAIALCRYWSGDGRWIVRLPANTQVPPGFNDGLNGIYTTKERNSKLAPHCHVIKKLGYNPEEPRYCSVDRTAITGIRYAGTLVSVCGKEGKFVCAFDDYIVVYTGEGTISLKELIGANNPMLMTAKSIGLDPNAIGYDLVRRDGFSWLSPIDPLSPTSEVKPGQSIHLQKHKSEALFLKPGTQISISGEPAVYVCKHSLHPQAKNSTDVLVYYGRSSLGMSMLSNDARELRVQAIELGLDPHDPNFDIVPLSSIKTVDGLEPEALVLQDYEYDLGCWDLEKGDVVKVSLRTSDDKWHEREAIVVGEDAVDGARILCLKQDFNDDDMDEDAFQTNAASPIAEAKEMGLELTASNCWYAYASDTKVIEKLGKHKKGVDFGGALMVLGAMAGAMIGRGLAAPKTEARVVDDVSSNTETEVIEREAEV